MPQLETCFLVKVPVEIHLLIANNLDPLERILLKLTNRYFYQIIEPLNHKELKEAQQLLYNQRGCKKQCIPGLPETQDHLKPYLACMTCSRLRLSSKFADEQQRAFPLLKVPVRMMVRFGRLPYKRIKRFCIDCGLKDGKYESPKSDIITVNGDLFRVCKSCQELTQTWKGTVSHTKRLCRNCYLGTLIEDTYSEKED